MSNTNPARGMRDFLPDAVRKRNYVIGIIREVYEKYGFEPLETPTIENLSTLTNKYGEEGDQLMFKILKRGEKLKKQLKRNDAKENDLTDLALRYDLTVPLARVVANYKNDLPKFFKRYQIQPVWRADRPAKGRYREFYQCDVDAIGSKSMIVEAELCSAVSEILERLGFRDFIIRMNHREILIGLLNTFGIEPEKHIEVISIIDKIDKIGDEKVQEQIESLGVNRISIENLISVLNSAKSISDGEKKAIVDLLTYGEGVKSGEGFIRLKSKHQQEILTGIRDTIISSKNRIVPLNNIKAYDNLSIALSEDKSATYALKEICLTLWRKTNLLGLVDYIQFDPTLARGLSYYTGAIFEVVLTNGDFTGSIAGGGRYDGLIGMFGKEEIPAVGLSIGLERILYVMEERGMFPDDLQTNSADVLVTVWNEESADESLKLANELRQKELRVMVYPQADKLGKQYKYANQVNVSYVCTIGTDELRNNTVRVKNMKTANEENVTRDKVAEKIFL